jgi:hypothetical protein
VTKQPLATKNKHNPTLIEDHTRSFAFFYHWKRAEPTLIIDQIITMCWQLVAFKSHHNPFQTIFFL